MRNATTKISITTDQGSILVIEQPDKKIEVRFCGPLVGQSDERIDAMISVRDAKLLNAILAELVASGDAALHAE
jgi:hypothetical protein